MKSILATVAALALTAGVAAADSAFVGIGGSSSASLSTTSGVLALGPSASFSASNGSVLSGNRTTATATGDSGFFTPDTATGEGETVSEAGSTFSSFNGSAGLGFTVNGSTTDGSASGGFIGWGFAD